MTTGGVGSDEARGLLERWVRTTWWRRRGLAARLSIERFERSGAFHLVLESFTESRSVHAAEEPYRGGPIDGPENGTPPDTWEMEAELPGTFVDDAGSYRVPHTSTVAVCHDCGGDGQVTCSSCGGDGQVTCSSCGGSGQLQRTREVTESDGQGGTSSRTESYSESCSCSMGQVSCSSCSGDGKVTCSSCQGACKLHHFERLDVVWSNIVDNRVIERTDLPDHLIEGVEGVAVLCEEQQRLEPTLGGGGGPFRGDRVRVDDEVDGAANELLRARAISSEIKLHRQRLTVRAVPVHECAYRWGKELRRFWIYGTEHRVFAPEYPLSWLRIGALVAGVAGAVGGVVAAVCLLG